MSLISVNVAGHGRVLNLFIKRSVLHTLGHLFSNGYPSDLFKDIAPPRDRSLIHISELTGCALKLWLQLREQIPAGFVTMPMAIGTSLHELTQGIVTALTPDVEVEVPVSYEPDYPVIGQADLVDREYVIDLKFLSDWGFKSYSSTSAKSFAYKIQVLAYAKALNKPLANVFIVNRGTLAFKAQTYIVKQHEDQIDFYLYRAKTIYELETEPDKGHSDGNNFECRYCPFRGRCWSNEGEPEE